MYCPECQVEYREGFLECSDCGVALLPGTPPEPPRYAERPPQPDLEVVNVLESNDPLIIAFAKSLLEEAGIAFYVQGEETGASLDSLTPFIHPWRQIQVTRDREIEARALFAALQETDPTEEETGEK